jgi:hypothetical protein
MAKKIKKSDSYKVGTGTERIKAAVDVGLGQLGFVKMSLDKKPIVSTGAPVGMQTLGTPSELAGKLLLIETAVTDASIMTNKMSVTHKLTGGVAAKTIRVLDEVAAPGDSILFQTFVLFKE